MAVDSLTKVSAIKGLSRDEPHDPFEAHAEPVSSILDSRLLTRNRTKEVVASTVAVCKALNRGSRTARISYWLVHVLSFLVLKFVA